MSTIYPSPRFAGEPSAPSGEAMDTGLTSKFLFSLTRLELEPTAHTFRKHGILHLCHLVSNGSFSALQLVVSYTLGRTKILKGIPTCRDIRWCRPTCWQGRSKWPEIPNWREASRVEALEFQWALRLTVLTDKLPPRVCWPNCYDTAFCSDQTDLLSCHSYVCLGFIHFSCAHSIQRLSRITENHFFNLRFFFRSSGVDLESQLGYEMALKGLPKPEGRTAPAVLNMKLLSLDLPDFVLGKTRNYWFRMLDDVVTGHTAVTL